MTAGQRPQLTLLGTGTQLVNRRRGQSGLLLEAGGERTLLDCGAGTLDRLARLDIDAQGLDRILLTHFHPDHTIDLATILFSLQHPSVQRARPLELVGPPGLIGLIERIAAAWPAVLYRDPDCFEARELTGGPHPCGPLSLTAQSTPHTTESQGYRLELAGGAIAYTGDTSHDAALAAWAHGADLLITECSAPDGRPVAGHMTASDAARLASAAGCRHLVLTHLYPACDAVEDLLAGARELFGGRITIAEDGMRIGLD